MRLVIRREERAFLVPLRTSRGDLRGRTSFGVAVVDGSGTLGLGEASPLIDAGTESPETCGAALARLGSPPTDVEDWEDWLLRSAPEAPAARFGVETAGWAAWAAQRGVPLAEAWARRWGSGAAGPWVEVSALLGAGWDAAAARAAGYRHAKLKVGGRALLEDEAAVAAACGLAVHLDANGAWDLPQARAALARLAPLLPEPRWIEQPVAGGLEDLRGGPFLVAGDEALTDEAEARRWVDGGRADGLVLKPARLGSPGAVARIAARAQEAGIAWWITTSLDGAVGRAATAALAAALDPRRERVHGLATGRLLGEADPIERGRWRLIAEGPCETP